MKYMDFQIVLNILKIKKILQTDWPNTFLPTTWELDFADIMFLAESQRQLWWRSFNTQKSTHWWIKFFYKTHIADLLQSTFGQAWLKQQFFFQRFLQFVILEHYMHARHAWSHPRKTLGSNWSFHGYLSTCKKQTFYPRKLLRY